MLVGSGYLVPAALCLAAMVLFSLFKAMHMSLYFNVLIKSREYRFIGLGNYARLVADEVFWLSLWNSVVWVFGSVGFQFVGGFGAALVLNQRFRGRAVLRTIALRPWVIPGVVVTLIWEYL